jgi:hypothetical protein
MPGIAATASSACVNGTRGGNSFDVDGAGLGAGFMAPAAVLRLTRGWLFTACACATPAAPGSPDGSSNDAAKSAPAAPMTDRIRRDMTLIRKTSKPRGAIHRYRQGKTRVREIGGGRIKFNRVTPSKTAEPRNMRGIISLTSQTPAYSKPAVPQAALGGTGAPEGKIEIAPAALEAMEDAFRRWWGENSDRLEDGDVGDIYGLFSSLKLAAAINASNSDSGISVAA